jgi:hypothetical protein
MTQHKIALIRYLLKPATEDLNYTRLCENMVYLGCGIIVEDEVKLLRIA